MRNLLFEKVFERFCRTAESAEDFEEHYNLHRVVLEVISDANDIEFQVLERSDLLSLMIRQLAEKSQATYSQIPQVLKKMVEANLKSKKSRSFVLHQTDLDLLAKSISQQIGALRPETETSSINASQSEPRRLGRKGLDIIEVLDSLVLLDDLAVDRSLHQNKLIVKLAVGSTQSVHVRGVSLEQPPTRSHLLDIYQNHQS